MITNEMMMCRMFKRLCNEQVVLEVNYQSKENNFKLASTQEQLIQMKIGKFVSIEKFIVVIKVGQFIQMKFMVCRPPEFIHDIFSPKSILVTDEGKLTIIYRNS